MPWCDHRKQSRKIPPQARMRFDNSFLLAGMGRGGRNDRPTVDRILQFRKRPGFSWRCRCVKFEIAGRDDVRCAKIAQTQGIG
jgi:hypothetical protein